MKELVEIEDIRTLDRTTAAAATGPAGRTRNATRAERLQQIAARANRRAQDRSKKIVAALGLDGTAKLTGSDSVGLLVREEINTEDSTYHKILHRLQVHCLAIHQ